MIDLRRTAAMALVVSALVFGSTVVPIPTSLAMRQGAASAGVTGLDAVAPTDRVATHAPLAARGPATAGAAGPGSRHFVPALEGDPSRTDSRRPGATEYVPITFDQTGLVLGTSWHVVVTDIGTIYSNGTSATLSLTAGEYSWTPGNVEGYGTTSGGNFTVVEDALWITVSYHGNLFTTYPVTFRSPQMPPGTPWSVDLGSGASASSTGPNLTFYEVNGTFRWSIGPTVHLSPTPDGGILQVNGTPVIVPIDWILAPGYFEVLFNETGLPAGFNWSVTLGVNTTQAFASPIGFIVPNGSYAFSDESPSGFVGHPRNGTATVHGGDTEYLIAFGSEIVPTYSIYFIGEFLPLHGTWSVTLAGLTLIANGPNVGMQFTVPNGSYDYRVRPPFGYMSTPSNGTVVVKGANVPTIILTFTPAPVPDYDVTFVETGLPTGTIWDVVWAGSTYHESSNQTIEFGANNGSYLWSVSSTTAYTPSPPTGELNISGPLAGPLSIRFAPPPVKFPVRFVETGLPNGTLWSVTITPGASYDSLNATIELSEANGSFAFLISNVSGLNSSPWHGTFSVTGGPLEIPVSWRSVTTSFLESANFWLVVSLSSATAIAAIALVWHYRRPRLPFSRREARRLLRKEFRR